MKTEDKARLEFTRFAAQYWSQEVGTQKRYPFDPPFQINAGTLSGVGLLEVDCLELTRLSYITQEHAIEVAEILRPNNKVKSIERLPKSRKVLILFKDGCRLWIYDNGGYSLDDGYLDGITGSFEDLRYYDFIRKNGYALEYDGNSLEEMISMGWMKYKKTQKHD